MIIKVYFLTFLMKNVKNFHNWYVLYNIYYNLLFMILHLGNRITY